MASAPLNKIERAHQMYRDGQHREALGFYTEALSMAKTKAQRIALHSNRAACFLKLQDFKQAAEECSSVLELDHKHTGALMLRAQTLVTLKEYHSALFDVNQLLELNPSSEVYQNLQARLRTQLSLAPIPECGAELEEDEEEEEEDKAEADDHKCGGEEEECGKEVDEKEEEMVDTEMDPETEPERTASNGEASSPDSQNTDESSDRRSIGWQAIPKPKGHSNLDYSRWDKVQDDSSDEDDDDEEEDECQPKYRFRVRTVGVRPVK